MDGIVIRDSPSSISPTSPAISPVEVRQNPWQGLLVEELAFRTARLPELLNILQGAPSAIVSEAVTAKVLPPGTPGTVRLIKLWSALYTWSNACLITGSVIPAGGV
jgi:hypothetical protein